MRYSWFKNKNSFAGMQAGGIKLDVSSLKVLLLNKEQQYTLNINNKKHKVTFEATCKSLDNKLCKFAISSDNNKLFIIRINNKKEYDNSLIYEKASFLSLCTSISRKLKFE